MLKKMICILSVASGACAMSYDRILDDEEAQQNIADYYEKQKMLLVQVQKQIDLVCSRIGSDAGFAGALSCGILGAGQRCIGYDPSAAFITGTFALLCGILNEVNDKDFDHYLPTSLPQLRTFELVLQQRIAALQVACQNHEHYQVEAKRIGVCSSTSNQLHHRKLHNSDKFE